MAGEACPADGCETRSFKPGSWADRPRSGTAVSGVVLLNLNSQNLRPGGGTKASRAGVGW